MFTVYVMFHEGDGTQGDDDSARVVAKRNLSVMKLVVMILIPKIVQYCHIEDVNEGNVRGDDTNEDLRTLT